MIIYYLDLLGCFAFAFWGSGKARATGFSTGGILLCGMLTALGGGTIREILLNQQPVYFHNYAYLIIAIAGCISALIIGAPRRPLHQIMLVADAIGLGTFAFIGAARADSLGLGSVPIIICATLTAAGGGIISDFLIEGKPLSVRNFYITPAMLTGLLYCLWQPQRPAQITMLILSIVCLRIAYLYRYRLQKKLPDALQPKSESPSPQM